MNNTEKFSNLANVIEENKETLMLKNTIYINKLNINYIRETDKLLLTPNILTDKEIEQKIISYMKNLSEEEVIESFLNNNINLFPRNDIEKESLIKKWNNLNKKEQKIKKISKKTYETKSLF